ncbi:TonB-dependent receptor-like protein [Sphingobium sp. SYK-6]|uniref:TonB-dependent receptor n=1 Tax=Sphingobium sp. (strain NBRC 103272 / SYK-6) TaxID=627192 RepID=UPI0002277556|nr:TonB-dependent receptor [Sphingobium sp. SYK-6]BAK66106.1 TonB-dependent receptor-like protein [Sphingobium sp. SYK-6]
MGVVAKLGTSFLALSVALSSPALAQGSASAEIETGEQGLQDIVVTAQRRSENVQRTALSVTAVTGETMVSRGVSQTEDLSRLTAGLQVQPSGGPYTTFAVRGVSQLGGNAFADPTVAVNLGGVYLATPTVIHGLYLDLDRVEILKGPQGTLYGRNATAGAINVIPVRPRFEFEGSLAADVGNYDRFNATGVLNIPISDNVAVRIAGQRVRRDGFMSDGTGDDKGEAVRASFLAEPTDNFSVLISFDWAHQGGKGPGATLRKPCAALGRTGVSCFVADPYTGVGDLASFYTSVGLAAQTRNPFTDGNYYGVGLNMDWTTTLGTVSLVGGYRAANVRYVTTATSWQLREQQEPWQKSVELRLASPSAQPFQYVFGAYYLDTDMKARANGENAPRRNYSDQHTNLWGWTGALFSQLTYGFTDAFRVTGGLRYTYEKKNSDSARYTLNNTVGPDPVIPDLPVGAPANIVRGSRDWNKVTWKAGVEFDAGPRNFLYASVGTGFKAGGFFYGPVGSQTYEPEKVTSYTVGSKNRFLDNKLQLNIEAFYSDYKDQQLSFVKLIGVSSTLVTENAGKSHAYGFELESEFLATPTTRLGTQIQYLKAKYDSFSYLTLAAPPATSACKVTAGVPQATVNCDGQPPLRAPEWTINGSIEQSFPLANGGRFAAEARGRYETEFQNDVSYVPETQGKPTARIDLSLSYQAPDNRWSIQGYVNNVTDVVTIASATMSNAYPNNQAVGIVLYAPRTFGVRGQVRF